MLTNSENMTFREWYMAAGYHHSRLIVMPSKRWNELRRAWLNGEDPTEYRAAKETA